jgi:hypothetical protein
MTVVIKSGDSRLRYTHHSERGEQENSGSKLTRYENRARHLPYWFFSTPFYDDLVILVVLVMGLVRNKKKNGSPGTVWALSKRVLSRFIKKKKYMQREYIVTCIVCVCIVLSSCRAGEIRFHQQRAHELLDVRVCEKDRVRACVRVREYVCVRTYVALYDVVNDRTFVCVCVCVWENECRAVRVSRYSQCVRAYGLSEKDGWVVVRWGTVHSVTHKMAAERHRPRNLLLAPMAHRARTRCTSRPSFAWSRSISVTRRPPPSRWSNR